MMEGGKIMTEKRKSKAFCGTVSDSGCCCVEAVVSVDERGQMVLPKELREKAKISPGDKFAVVSFGQTGAFCCLTLIKADDLAGSVKDVLGPMFKGLAKD